MLTQRFFTFFLLLSLLTPAAWGAELKTQLPKSPDQRYLAAAACLQQKDTPCAQVALAGIPPTSPYARILEAQIAAAHSDFDSVLRNLLPLQAETSLLPQARASLHATLAAAYVAQDNLLRAVEQYSLTEPWLDSPDAVQQNQSRLWELLAKQRRSLLIELRGQSPNPVIQGWLDLAIAYTATEQRGQLLGQWRASYPDHPIHETLLSSITSAVPPANNSGIVGNVALILPLDEDSFADAAQAILAGFKTAHDVLHYQVNIQIYPTDGTPEKAISAYQHAVLDGMQYVVGPLARNEVDALASSGQVTLPTLTLNQPETTQLPERMRTYGMSVEAESRQAAQLAIRTGLQSIQLLHTSNLVTKRMAAAFAEEWKAQGGGALKEQSIPVDENQLNSLKQTLDDQPSDAIFLAADAVDARRVRPYLNTAIPTYATSHIFDGDANNELNQTLNAIHFLDMPWLLSPNREEFSAYRKNAAELGKGWPQRWFALGADAYQLLPLLSSTDFDHPLLQGLTGNISLTPSGRFVRTLQPAQFLNNDVALEPLHE